jgi:hypothetical protein
VLELTGDPGLVDEPPSGVSTGRVAGVEDLQRDVAVPLPISSSSS